MNTSTEARLCPAMLSALYSALNLEAAAKRGVQASPALADLDVDYHMNKIRAAIAEAEGPNWRGTRPVVAQVEGGAA